MKKFLLVFSLIIIGQTKLSAQSCFNINAGNDTTISCLQSCLDLKARVPNIKTSETYQVVPIAYAPYPYTSPLGNELTALYADDLFSNAINLPFTFCFYGQNYTQIVAGSNGVLTFDVATNQNTDESYVIAGGNALPYAGGVPGNIGIFYAPRASIFLGYYDMDPRSGESPPERKIEWRLEGTAPCRKLVISYYHLDFYNSGGCQGQGLLCTMQAVLYEGTGLIDMFYENKPSCLTYQNGLSIAGLQNWGQNQAVTAPGKNCTVWNAVNEGNRYIPNGSTSLVNRVELYKNGTLISTATNTDLGNGQLESLFSNVCQSEDSMSYVVKAFYQRCDNPAIETEASDTMIVYKNLSPINTTVANPLCYGGLGTITITNPVSPNLEFSIDGGLNWQNSPVFNVPAGNYTIQARVIGSLCGGSTTAIVTEPTQLTARSFPTAASCTNKDGVININALGGTPAYAYSIDGGLTYQASNSFTGLSVGIYNNILVKDANGCKINLAEQISLNDTMRLNLGPDSTICFGNSLTLIPQTNALTDTFKWRPAASLNYDTVRTPIATPIDTTTYILDAKWGVCRRSDTITINVLHKPVPNAGADTTICAKTPAFLHGSASNTSGQVYFTWAPVSALLTYITPDSSWAMVLPDSSQQFIFTIKDGYGCNFNVSDTMKVFIDPPVPAFAGNDTNAVRGVPHQLLASGGATYLWSPTGSLNNPFIQNPLATLFTDTYFRVKVTDVFGCSATDDVFIKVYEGPTYYVPNAFSPNGDGLNDIFRPIPVGISVTEYFNVFNRLGELVFQTNQWLKGWDGKYKGKDALAGTYAWVIKGIDRNNRAVEMQGTVILIR